MSERTAVDVADKALDKLSGGIESVANSLKNMAPHAWEALVRKQVIEGWVDLTMCVVYLVAFAFAARVAWRKTACLDDYNDSRVIARIITIGIPGFIAACVLFSSIPDSIMQLTNPEFFAAKEVFEWVKPQ